MAALSFLKSAPIFLLAVVAISAMVLENGADHRLPQQILHGNKKFMLTQSTVAFAQAPRFCEENYASFVAIQNADKDLEVLAEVGSRITDSAWIGGRRDNTCDNFVWVIPNQVFEYTNWPSRGNESEKTGCVYYGRKLADGLKWHVGDCNEKKLVVCEY